MGDALIPSAAGDPGYKDLEAHGISQEVLKGLQGLSDDLLGALNRSSQGLFEGKSLVELEEKEREKYLKAIIGGKSFVDKGMLLKLQTAYKMLRLRILTVYYQNFPENRVPKDARGVPTTQDLHQISNPNTRELVTGWDVAKLPGAGDLGRGRETAGQNEEHPLGRRLKMRTTVLLICLLLLGSVWLADVTPLPAQKGEAEADLSLLLPEEGGEDTGSGLLLHVSQSQEHAGGSSQSATVGQHHRQDGF